ncbi:hypothetical protein NL533_30995, partial [Klebsiella pneumoniae]|nr:hypothetical protein [Klebsiella pneumoniae]
YGSDASFLDNFIIQGNSIFLSGTLEDQNSRNLLVGGTTITHDPIVLDNTLFRTGPNSPASDFDLGYSAGCSNASVTGNYISSNTYFVACSP